MSVDSFSKRTLQLHCPVEYYEAVKKNKEAIFPYLMPSDQPDAKLIEWINRCNEKYPALINLGDRMERLFPIECKTVAIYPTGLPPLSSALLCGRVNVAEALCRSPHIDFNHKDLKGWTPVQHAIARGSDLIDRIDQTARGKFPFLRAVRNGKIAPNDQIVITALNPDGTVRELSQKAFRKYSGGLPFSSQVIGSAEALFHNWYSQNLISPSWSEWFQKRYAEFCRKAPLLHLASPVDSELGVRAGSAIRASSMVAFAGTVLPPPLDELEKTEAALSWGNLLNDGFPNVCKMEMNIDGVVVKGLFALRDIRPGEQLMCDTHFTHGDKWTVRDEWGLEDFLTRFPDTRAIIKSWNVIERQKSSDSQDIETIRNRLELLYLFNTPSLLLSLVMSGRYEISSIEKLFDDSKFIRFCDFETNLGPTLVAFYRNAFALIRRTPQAILNDERFKNYLAAHFRSSVRVAFIAAHITFDQWEPDLSLDLWKENFIRILKGAIGFYQSGEFRDVRREVSKSFKDLSQEEQNQVTELAHGKIGFSFKGENEKECLDSLFR